MIPLSRPLWSDLAIKGLSGKRKDSKTNISLLYLEFTILI